MRVVLSLTIFVSALLLFLVQPMFTKMILPLLGGSPAVWNGALVFFQGALLVGYLYAHLTARWLTLRQQTVVHLVLLLLALGTLPVTVPAGWSPPAGTSPVPWLMAVLSVGVGLPFVLLSSGSPMLQRWFAHSSHPAASNPYPLYAISNLGSLSALLAYPFLLEPNVPLRTQSFVWTGGFALLVLLTGASAVLLRRPGRPAGEGDDPPSRSPAPKPNPTPRPVTWSDRAWWVTLAFVPSSLLLGVTTYLTTDVAAVPLLWVVPLALYLLTFVIVFARRRRVLSHAASRAVQTACVAMLVLVTFWGVEGPMVWTFTMHLAVFFFSALVVHGELAERRPAAVHLTAFYLWMSLGGVLGGMFNALLAPVLFDSVVEYEWMVVAACALGWTWRRPAWRLWSWQRVAALVPLVVLAPLMYLETRLGPPTTLTMFAASAIAYAALMTLWRTTAHLAIGVATILVLTGIYHDRWEGIVYAHRGFFGAYSVTWEPEGNYHLLQHGTTIHGGQFLDPGRRLDPVTYYHRDGPIGQLLVTLSPPPPGAAVAVIGLGTGALACHGTPDQRWTFYEIDPGIARLAADPQYFSYLRDCPPEMHVELGDGRLAIERAPRGAFDLIVLDAFSSDALPVHLLTREAFGIYLDKLADDGMLAIHISNRYLDLRPVMAALASELHLHARLRALGNLTPEQEAELAYESDWVVMTRTAGRLDPLRPDTTWVPLEPDSARDAWTDDHSDIVTLVHWR